jgi:alkaline phosphatase D
VFEGGEAIATEFVGPSISSSFPDAVIEGIDLRTAFNALPGIKPNLVFTDSGHHGYVMVEVTPDKLTARYRVVDSVAQSSSPVSTLATFDVSPGKVGPVKRS